MLSFWRLPFSHTETHYTPLPSATARQKVPIENWTTDPVSGRGDQWGQRNGQFSMLYGPVDLPQPTSLFQGDKTLLTSLCPKRAKPPMYVASKPTSWRTVYIWQPFSDPAKTTFSTVPTHY